MLGLGAIVLAILLHYRVERAFHIRSGWKTKNTGASSNTLKNSTLIIVSTFTVLICSHIFISNGWTWRFPTLSYTPDEIAIAKAFRYDGERFKCQIHLFPDSEACEADRALNFLFFGNSHEPDAVNFTMAGYGDALGAQAVSFGTINRCNLEKVGDVWKSDWDFCQTRIEALFDIERLYLIDAIFYSEHKPFGLNKRVSLEILKDIKKIRPDIPIISFGGFLEIDQECSTILNFAGDSNMCLNHNRVTWIANDRSEPLFEEFMRITDHYIDRINLLCNEAAPEECLSRTPEGVPIFFDRHHLSREYAEMSGRLYAQQNPKILHEIIADLKGTH